MTNHSVHFSKPLLSVSCRDGNIQVSENTTHSDASLALDQPFTRDDVESLLHATEQLYSVVRDHESRRQESMNELQQLAIELGFAVAEKLVRGKIKQDEFPIAEMVSEIVSRAEPAATLKFYLNPRDLAFANESQVLANDSQPNSISFHEDSTLARGSCRADCGNYDIVSQIELELAELRYHLLGTLDDAQIERQQTDQSDSGIQRFPDRRTTR
jgi:hypothetical protein